MSFSGLQNIEVLNIILLIPYIFNTQFGKGHIMDEKILQEILKELKELNNNLSAKQLDTGKRPMPNFAEHLIGSINSITKSLFGISQSLANISEKLPKN